MNPVNVISGTISSNSFIIESGVEMISYGIIRIDDLNFGLPGDFLTFKTISMRGILRWNHLFILIINPQKGMFKSPVIS